jgi:gliding motility-associated-like protein
MRLNKLILYPQLLILVFLLSAQHVYANHLKGGWIKYTYIGATGDNIQYRISFYQYSDCGQPDKVDPGIYLAVFDAVTSAEIGSPDYIPKTSLTVEKKSDFGPCFTNPPYVCYLVAEYTAVITVPKNQNGYTLTVQRCCRIAGIANVPNSNSTGLTYTITIPGGSNIADNSPLFKFNDTVAICYGSYFTFDFSAHDDDGDSLAYTFCSGITGGSELDPVVEQPPPPPYAPIPYLGGYSGGSPMGASVTIDPKTGIVSGFAPVQTGTYVLAVCIDEFRHGVYIGHTRKELHIDVSNCQLGGADLDPTYINCDSYSFNFVNRAYRPDFQYSWDFGVTSTTSDTSSKGDPTFTFPDTGVYNVKLKARNGLGCEDSAKTEVKIFPGFKTDFSVDGSCIKNPYNFTDLTTATYGYVQSWQWFFGDNDNMSDTAKNPLYTYQSTGQKTITLVTTSSKGCIDTATHILQVDDGPNLNLRFVDTLICSIDTLQLNASSTTNGAVFKWAPYYAISDTAVSKPLVYPKQSTTYGLTVSYKGCVTSDSVRINVIDKVDLSMPFDTTICKTDAIQLSPSTNALYFSWSPPAGLNGSSIASPLATPLSNTTYALAASVGKCVAKGATTIRVVPYPAANAGADAVICYGKTTQLSANITGSNFLWSPVNSMVDPNSLSPVVGPATTTKYALQVYDTLGCPKPSYDSVLVTVIPKVIAFAGHDTSIVRSQPLQLNATGGANYKWTPSSNLSNAFIANPVALFNDGPDTVSYNVRVSTPDGCFGNDSIKIFIFNTKPDVFIPSAFTPNGDGLNDVFRPTVAGMKQFLYFRVYNRWGQLLFNTSALDKGWDGTYNGTKQESGTYVYSIEAIDFNNKSYLKKGTFVLIR